jgi:hypothetical protein
VNASITIPDGYTREELLACVDREIRLRELNYPRWVEQGRMREKVAKDGIAAMQAVRAVIAQLPARQTPLSFAEHRIEKGEQEL